MAKVMAKHPGHATGCASASASLPKPGYTASTTPQLACLLSTTPDRERGTSEQTTMVDVCPTRCFCCQFMRAQVYEHASISPTNHATGLRRLPHSSLSAQAVHTYSVAPPACTPCHLPTCNYCPGGLGMSFCCHVNTALQLLGCYCQPHISDMHCYRMCLHDH